MTCLSASCAPGLPEERKYSISAQFDNKSSGVSTTGPDPYSFLASKCSRSASVVCLRAHEIGLTSNKAAF